MMARRNDNSIQWGWVRMNEVKIKAEITWKTNTNIKWGEKKRLSTITTRYLERGSWDHCWAAGKRSGCRRTAGRCGRACPGWCPGTCAAGWRLMPWPRRTPVPDSLNTQRQTSQWRNKEIQFNHKWRLDSSGYKYLLCRYLKWKHLFFTLSQIINVS